MRAMEKTAATELLISPVGCSSVRQSQRPWVQGFRRPCGCLHLGPEVVSPSPKPWLQYGGLTLDTHS